MSFRLFPLDYAGAPRRGFSGTPVFRFLHPLRGHANLSHKNSLVAKVLTKIDNAFQIRLTSFSWVQRAGFVVYNEMGVAYLSDVVLIPPMSRKLVEEIITVTIYLTDPTTDTNKTTHRFNVSVENTEHSPPLVDHQIQPIVEESDR